MDRLTKRISGYAHGAEGVSADRLTGNYCRGEFEATACVEKLAEYEDLEEQGKLLKLPCKPEDKLYWISDQDEDAEFIYEPIEEVKVCNIDYNGYSLQLWFADKGAKEFPVLEVSSIGKELFYTREAAEAALKEMNE